MNPNTPFLARCAAEGFALAARASARLITGSRSIWYGCEPASTQRIYFANHNSHVDFILLWASLPTFIRRNTRPVAASDYWLKDRLRRFIIQDTFSGVTIQRLREGQSDPLQPVKDALASGNSIIFFPEGTRNLEDDVDLLEFKSGLYRLAQAFPQVQVVPVWISNLRRVMPKGAVLPVPLLSTVVFGTPLQPEAGMDKDSYLRHASDSLLSLKEVHFQ